MSEATAMEKERTRCAKCAIECEKMVKGGAEIDWHDPEAWFCCQRCGMTIIHGIRPANLVNRLWSARAKLFRETLKHTKGLQRHDESIVRKDLLLTERPEADTELILWSKFMHVVRDTPVHPMPVHRATGHIVLTDQEWIYISKSKLTAYYTQGSCTVAERHTLERLIDLAVA